MAVFGPSTFLNMVGFHLTVIDDGVLPIAKGNSSEANVKAFFPTTQILLKSMMLVRDHNGLCCIYSLTYMN